MTQFPDGFVLLPGEAFKYAWSSVYFDKVLEFWHGGLFARRDKTWTSSQTSSRDMPPSRLGFLNATLGYAQASDQPPISSEKQLHELLHGYRYVGNYDLRHLVDFRNIDLQQRQHN